MESNFSNREFEQYIKQNADQYRMFPSDKVWKGVNNALHTRRKWYGFWLGFLLLLTGAAVTWVMTSHPALKRQEAGLSTNTSIYSSPEQETSEAAEAPKNIEDLLPFKKQSFPAGNSLPLILTNSTGIGPSFILEQDFKELEMPVPNSSSVSEIGPEKVLSSNVSRLISDNNVIDIVSSPEEVIIIGPAAQKTIATDEKSVAAADKSQASRLQPGFSPLTIESVVNTYQVKRASKRISWQIFVTPTVSYRRLSVNKSFDSPVALNYPFAALSDVNNAVTHKPDVGLQIGLSGRYPIAKNLKLRGGFQFNINRYDIKAYAFNGEVATIDLDGGVSNGNSTISTWTNYRNFSGYRPNWLKNFYFSVSAPIGAELKLFGNAKTNVGIAGTLQPTYIISDRAYLLSTDYKNYAEVPRLIRHVNLNTSFETFVNYTSGKTNWQIGPQVRYQILSSFQNKYPVKENLFDFGLKVGVTLNN